MHHVMRPFNVHRPSGVCSTLGPSSFISMTTSVIVYGVPAPSSEFNSSVISEGNNGAVASARIRRMYCSSPEAGSDGMVHLHAVLARALEIPIAEYVRMAALRQINTPSFARSSRQFVRLVSVCAELLSAETASRGDRLSQF